MRNVCRTPFDAGAPLPTTVSKPPAHLFSQVAVKHGSDFVSLNVEELRAGDVLLFKGRTKGSATVKAAQACLFDADTAAWTHCGILDENFVVWDAMPRGDIRCRSLNEVLRQPETISGVRPIVEIAPRALSHSLIEFANGEYRIFKVETGGRLVARLFRSGLPAAQAISDRPTICSLFVANVLRHATKHPFFAKQAIVLPADFLVDTDFGSILLSWTAVQSA